MQLWTVLLAVQAGARSGTRLRRGLRLHDGAGQDGSSNGGKKGSSSKTKKQYIGDLCNTAYVGIGCKSIKSNTAKVKVYRYSSSCNWRC